MKKYYFLILLFAGFFCFLSSCTNETATYKTLIITGQNNHNWQVSSPILKQILDQSGLFTAEIMTTPAKGGDMTAFAPDFSKYKLVVLDYNGDSWTTQTNDAFVDYVKNGGGVVVYHAADNSFPEWKEYNEMIGLGGWGGRSEKDGPYVYYSRNELVTDTSAGVGGSHGKRHDFEVRTRVADHPITKGLPARWMHGNDELYQQLRGPAKNMTVLATAFADTTFGGTGRDEPMLMVLNYEKGRIFHTAMGHADEGGGPAMQCSGFITTFLRGAEWAVTGDVKQPVPFDFPTAAGVVLRSGFAEITIDEAFANIGSYDIDKSTKYLTTIQNYIRLAEGNAETLLGYEKLMNKILINAEASVESKKLILRELSWMGTEYSIPAIKELAAGAELKDEAEFALARLQK